MDTETQGALHGALLPIVRQVVQHAAGLIFGVGFLTQDQATQLAGLLIGLGTLVWMLAARVRAAQAGKS
jgi:hypothetical protein